MQNPTNLIQLLQNNIGQAVVGKEEAVEYALIALICKGHVLIEDVPGVGKTTLASALARSLACSFRRIQFTPDLMPSDVTGFSMVNMKTGEMEFHEGAVMSQIVLADEINRTSPKTQSALLEVMEEGQVTVDGVTYQMPQPFCVLATQNPQDFVGTYPLPEAQMDRFFLRISIGYPTQDEEREILSRYTSGTRPLQSLRPVCTAQDVIELQGAVAGVLCNEEIRDYVVRLAAATRNHPSLSLGASTRAAIALVQGSKACALLSGRNYTIPEDVQYMALPVLAHRLVLTPEARMRKVSTEQLLLELLQTIPVGGRRR